MHYKETPVDIEHSFDCKFCCKALTPKKVVYKTTVITGICCECRYKILPKHMPYIQQIRYFKLRELKNVR